MNFWSQTGTTTLSLSFHLIFTCAFTSTATNSNDVQTLRSLHHCKCLFELYTLILTSPNLVGHSLCGDGLKSACRRDPQCTRYPPTINSSDDRRRPNRRPNHYYTVQTGCAINNKTPITFDGLKDAFRDRGQTQYIDHLLQITSPKGRGCWTMSTNWLAASNLMPHIWFHWEGE